MLANRTSKTSLSTSRFVSTTVICCAVCLSFSTYGFEGRTVASSLEIGTQMVNRVHKGDRSTGTVLTPGRDLLEGLPSPSAPLVLTDGCESAVSSIADEQLARVPSRCVS